MTGAGRQPEIPASKIPDNGRDHGPEEGSHGNEMGINQTFADCFGHGRATQGADQVEKSGQQNGLARRSTLVATTVAIELAVS